MNEKKNNDILTISSKNGYPESRNLESSAQRGKSLTYKQQKVTTYHKEKFNPPRSKLRPRINPRW